MARKRTRTKRSRNTRRVPRTRRKTRRKTRRRVIRKTRTQRGGKSKRRRRNRLRSKLQRGGALCYDKNNVVQAWGDPIKITRENGYEHIVEINPNPNFWQNEIGHFPNDCKVAEVLNRTPGHPDKCNVLVQTHNNEPIVIKVRKENIESVYGDLP